MNKKQPEKLHASLKLIIKSSVVVLVGLVFSKLLSYLYRIIIARSLGPEIYGLFSLSLMFAGFFIMFFSLGLPEGLLRFIPLYRGKNQPTKVSFLLRRSVIALTIMGFIAGLVLFFISDFIAVTIFHNTQLIPYLKGFSIAMPFTILTALLLATLQAFEKIGWNSFLNNIFQNGVRLLLLLLFIFLGLRTQAVIFSYVIGVFCMFVLASIVVRKLFKKRSKHHLEKAVKRTLVQHVWSYSWPLIFLGAIYNFYSWIDSFVIGYFRSATDVGFYNAAFTIVCLMGITPELFRQMFFPLVIKAFSQHRKTLVKDMSKQVAKWTFIINLPFFILVFLFPGAVINLLYGPAYIVSQNVLRILIVGGFSTSFTIFLTSLLSMQGKSKILLVNTIIFGLLNLILNVVLIGPYGLHGIAFATALSWILFNAVLFIEVKQTLLFIPLRRKMVRIFFVSLFPTLLLLILKEIVPLTLSMLFLLTLLFLSVYILLIFLMGCFDKHDRFILHSLKGKMLQKMSPLLMRERDT